VFSTKNGSGDLTPGDNERAMHCVRVGNLPFVHWVLQRPDCSYMDPAGGGGTAFTSGIRQEFRESHSSEELGAGVEARQNSRIEIG
jgi:hypothetical protein